MEGGDSNKEKASSSKKRKSAPGMEIEEMDKEGNEMEMDDSDGEDGSKDEEVGNEEESGDNESDNEIPFHSDFPDKDNSYPMEDVEYKNNEEIDVNSKRERNKEPKKDMTKDILSEDKESVDKGLFLNNLKKITEDHI
ncbi:uncharacterized protein LOC131857422 [Cryptomeria japonica]|uniref:uncharacterized protein LOC131857422 n=1 Tax=Cryptomeria japonica TaxID=3369 RepID=UPI0027D9FDC2|nr:uncharacterized protein LOC131857422 [Cryptomeria japonica]